jgi:hypothetical protein
MKGDGIGSDGSCVSNGLTNFKTFCETHKQKHFN